MHKTRWRVALTATIAAIVIVAMSAMTPNAHAAVACRIDYAVSSQWPGGFTANVTIANLGDPVNGWRLTWSFGAGQKVTEFWNATISQSGSQVTATNASWNGTLGTGTVASMGFNGSWSGSNPVPTSFALNGTACNGGGTATTTTRPAQTTTTRPATTTTTAPPAGSWPAPTGQQTLTATMSVSGTFDGGLRRYVGGGDLGSGGQAEDQDPLFNLASGATLQNVIIGAPAADGIHCAGACTLRNVWWEDVGEDAATFRGSSSSISSLVDGGGARLASDKVFQHNGAGTVTIRNFQVERFGKLYRSCGNCGTQFQRHVVIQNVTVTAPGDAIAGVNTNFGDSATFSGITIIGDPGRDITICQKYIGNSTGDEPIENGSGADGTFCRYSSSEITYR